MSASGRVIPFAAAETADKGGMDKGLPPQNVKLLGHGLEAAHLASITRAAPFCMMSA